MIDYIYFDEEVTSEKKEKMVYLTPSAGFRHTWTEEKWLNMKTEKPPKTKFLHVRADQEWLDALERFCDETYRTKTSVVTEAVREYIKKKSRRKGHKEPGTVLKINGPPAEPGKIK
jgi:hypothetical protein